MSYHRAVKPSLRKHFDESSIRFDFDPDEPGTFLPESQIASPGMKKQQGLSVPYVADMLI